MQVNRTLKGVDFPMVDSYILVRLIRGKEEKGRAEGREEFLKEVILPELEQQGIRSLETTFIENGGSIKCLLVFSTEDAIIDKIAADNKHRMQKEIEYVWNT